MGITRRTLQRGLAVLWLLDGALQLQPFMFHAAFARTVLAPAAAGQPGLIGHPAHWAGQLVMAHPAITNTGFAGIQLALGVGLLTRRWVRMSLLASIAWALGVWWLGEGLGDLAHGATVFSGAPGAALLYAVIALLAFPDRAGRSDIAPPSLAAAAWAALWLSGAALQLAAGNNSGAALAATFNDAASENPGWIAAIDHSIGRLHIPNAAVAALIAVQVIIGAWPLLPGAARRIAVAAGSVLATATWVVLQGFGDLTSGQATDPNSGPLILLLGVAVLGSATTVLEVGGVRGSPHITTQAKLGRTSRVRFSS